MQIDTLKTFCDLVETESFTKAAQINNVTQSAVSQQLTAMERQAQSLLVERSKKHFRLTREGELFYQCSKEIVRAYEALLSKLQETKDMVSGGFQVSAIYSIGLHELPAYLKRYLKDFPTVNVHVEYRRSNEVYQDVLSNVADLGLVAFPHRVNNLEVIQLHKFEMVLICSPQHPLACKKTVRLKDLAGQKFVSFESDMPTRKAVDKIFRERGIVVRHVMEFGNIETVKRAVEIDAGIAIVPHSTVTQELASNALAVLKFEGVDMSRPWAVIHKKSKVLSPAMKQFIKILKEDL